MRKLFAIILAAVVIVGAFAGCSKNDSKDSKNEKSANTSTSSEAKPKGETVDVGNFKVFVPDGWKFFIVPDVFSDEANDADPDAARICKGGETDTDILSHPYIQINYYGADSQMMKPSKDLYEESKDVQPIKAGSFTWNGFTAKSLGYDIAILWYEDGDDQYQATIYTDTPNGKISFEDEDVLQILGGIEKKA